MNLNYDIINQYDITKHIDGNEKYDLIILDIDNLENPVSDVIMQIKSETNALILVTTSDLSEETGILAMENGADDIVYKPIRQIEFWIKISNLIRMHSYQNRLEEEKGILKQFVSAEIADHIMNDKSTNAIKTYATILFFDIRNSTSMAETISPLELAKILNDVINQIIDIIYKNMGSVNNILGDGVLATFGYPVVYEYDVLRAIKAVDDIRQMFEVTTFSRPIKYGIGITTGSMFSGNIGNSRKMTCTVLGDTVNTAARLQSLTKKAAIDALIDFQTFQQVEPYITYKKYVGKVRGKAEPIEIYYPKTIDRVKLDNMLDKSNEQINNNLAGIGDIEFF